MYAPHVGGGGSEGRAAAREGGQGGVWVPSPVPNGEANTHRGIAHAPLVNQCAQFDNLINLFI